MLSGLCNYVADNQELFSEIVSKLSSSQVISDYCLKPEANLTNRMWFYCLFPLKCEETKLQLLADLCVEIKRDSSIIGDFEAIFSMKADLVAQLLHDLDLLNKVNYIDKEFYTKAYSANDECAILLELFDLQPDLVREFVKARIKKDNLFFHLPLATIIPEFTEEVVQKTAFYILGRDNLQRPILDAFNLSKGNSYLVAKQQRAKSEAIKSLIADTAYCSPTSLLVQLPLQEQDLVDIELNDIEIIEIIAGEKRINNIVIDIGNLVQKFKPNYITLSSDVYARLTKSLSACQTLEDFCYRLGVKMSVETTVDRLPLAGPQPKDGEIFLGSAQNDGELDASTEKQQYHMQLSGKVLNSDFSDRPQIITSLSKFIIAEKAEFQSSEPKSLEIITPNIITPENISAFKSSKSGIKIYASLNIALTSGNQIFLPCLSSIDEFEGIVGSKLDGLRIFKGDHGFYYAQSDRNIELNYIVSTELEKKATLSEGSTAKQIIETFRAKQKPYTDIAAMPEDGDIKKWLKTAYEQKSGACRHRVAAVYNKLLEHEVSADNIRALGINGNHIIIEVKDKSNWVPYDLGGQVVDLTYDRIKKSKGHTEKTGLTATELDIPAEKEETSLAQPKAETTSQDIAFAQLLYGFKVKFSFKPLDLSTLASLSSRAEHKILLATKQIDEHAHYLIKQHKENVFYIDNPDQLNFTRSKLKIAEDGSIALTKEADLASFLSMSDGNRLLVVNWSVFSSKQKVALNTLLDREPTIAGSKIPEEVKIISLDRVKTEDPSFASRHNIAYQSFMRPKLIDPLLEREREVEAKVTVTKYTDNLPIDLLGLSDWRQALFGKISLNRDSLIWHKSPFAIAIQEGNNNFTISNIGSQAAKSLNDEFKLAQAKGYFDYHGYKLTLPDGFNIKVKSNDFDFSKFSAIEVSKDSKYNQEAEIVNNHIFDLLLHQHHINEKGEYQETPGLIAQNAAKSLKLLITSELTEEQYYCMLNEASRFNVSLKLYLAHGVKLPMKLKQTALTASSAPHSGQTMPVTNGPKIIVTNDLSSYKAQADQAVINVEDFDFSTLISSITYQVSGAGFYDFHEHQSEFIEGLRKGNKFVLQGEFTDEMLNILAPLIAKSQANLTILIEEKSLRAEEVSYSRLAWLADSLEFRYQELLEREAIPKTIEIEPADKSFDLEHSELKAQEFLKARKSLIKDKLITSNMLLLEGQSGVGKSSIIKEFTQSDQDTISIHRELSSFEQWAMDTEPEKTKILFIDESNIEDKHFTLFCGMKTDGEKKLFYNGKFYPLTTHHKVVFACNPIEYGGGRFAQKLFNQGDIPIIEFKDFPASYIYENILKSSIYCEAIAEQLDEPTFKAICSPLIQSYKENQTVTGDTVRELQEQVLKTLLTALKIAPARDLRGKNFITTTATKAAEQTLYEAINIRSKQRNGIFNNVASGLNGLLLEGGAGVGKSEMIKEMLSANNIRPYTELGGHCYHKIEADLPFSEKKHIIIKAFEAGNIIWLDEINSCIDDGLEKLLNSVLTGIHPETGEKSAKAGFMLLASCNSAGLEGRSIISPALRHRMSSPKLKELAEYEIAELTVIIKHWYRHDSIDDAKVIKLATAFKKIISTPEYKDYNLRMLRDVLIARHNLTELIHYKEIEEVASKDLYKDESLFEISGNDLDSKFTSKLRSKPSEGELIKSKIAKSLQSTFDATVKGDLSKQQINPINFIKLVIEFAKKNDGVSNAPTKAVESFKQEYGEGIYYLAKRFSAAYQKCALINGLYTGRQDGDDGLYLRTDIKIGARLNRIPTELTDEVIEQALKPIGRSI